MLPRVSKLERRANEERARRARYLDAARALFVVHGYEGTSTDMIVAAVGGSKATLYKHFPSKESLVEGLIDQAASRAQPAQAPEALPLREALTQLGRATLDAVVSDAAAAALRLCLGSYGRFPQLARTVWDHGPALTYARFAGFLERRCAAGELVVPDTQLACEHFLAGIAGHIQLKVAMGVCPPPDEAERARRVDAAVETFLARYAAPPSKRRRSPRRAAAR